MLKNFDKLERNSIFKSICLCTSVNVCVAIKLESNENKLSGMEQTRAQNKKPSDGKTTSKQANNRRLYSTVRIASVENIKTGLALSVSVSFCNR